MTRLFFSDTLVFFRHAAFALEIFTLRSLLVHSTSSACCRTCNVAKARCLSTVSASAARAVLRLSCTLRCLFVNSILGQCVTKMRKNRFHSTSNLVFEITLQPQVCCYYAIAVHCSRLWFQPRHSVQPPNLTERKSDRRSVSVSQRPV